CGRILRVGGEVRRHPYPGRGRRGADLGDDGRSAFLLALVAAWRARDRDPERAGTAAAAPWPAARRGPGRRSTAARGSGLVRGASAPDRCPAALAATSTRGPSRGGS